LDCHNLGYLFLRFHARNKDVDEVNELVLNYVEDLAEYFSRNVCKNEDSQKFDEKNQEKLNKLY
jgi:hypothetical protein